MKKIKLLFTVIIVGLNLFVFGQAISQSNLDKMFFLDGHTHHGFPSLDINEIDLDMKYLKSIRYNSIVHALPVDRTRTNDLYSRVSSEIAQLKVLSEKSSLFIILSPPTELLDKKDNDKINCLFSIEHFRGSIFNSDTSLVRKYKNLGIGYITIVNTEEDKLFIENENKSELSMFGREIIEKMNEHNVKIDISHMSEQDMLEVIKHSNSPVLASHSSSAKISQSEDNLSDKVLNEIKNNKGLVLVSFRQNRLFNSNEKTSDGIEQLATHIDYLKSIIGIKSIGIGTDIQARGKYMANSLSDADTIKKITECLLNRGYSIEEIEGIFYKNYIEFINKMN